MKKLTLLIDDIRNIESDLVARGSILGREYLKTHKITHLYLDNDLGDDQDMEGIDILAWARNEGCVPSFIYPVTANPVARRRMIALLENDLGYVNNAGWWSA
jgi:hypothetical protein